MTGLRIGIVLLGMLYSYIIMVMADGLRFVSPAIVELFIYSSTSATMKGIILTSKTDWQMFLSFGSFLFQLIPGAIFWAPVLWMTWAFKHPALAVLPAVFGFLYLGYAYLLNNFNPDAQGALVYIFGPIYALIVAGIVFVLILLGQYLLPKFRRT